MKWVSAVLDAVRPNLLLHWPFSILLLHRSPFNHVAEVAVGRSDCEVSLRFGATMENGSQIHNPQ